MNTTITYHTDTAQDTAFTDKLFEMARDFVNLAELIAALNKEMTHYLNVHPYSAPHAVTDFVIEIIDISPLSANDARAYIGLGS